jgi:hypothetical protein
MCKDVYRGAEMETKRIKHTVNGDEQNGWYCYVCQFFSRDVAKAAEHDGLVENKAESL